MFSIVTGYSIRVSGLQTKFECNNCLAVALELPATDDCTNNFPYSEVLHCEDYNGALLKTYNFKISHEKASDSHLNAKADHNTKNHNTNETMIVLHEASGIEF